MTEQCEPVQLPDGRILRVLGGPMTDDDAAHLQALVDAVPPLTDEQVERQRVMRKRNHDRLVRLGLVDR